MNVDHIGVHVTHCCVLHGCKYLDDDCVVKRGEEEQAYLCEDCAYAGIKSFVELDQAMMPRDIDKVKKTFDEIGLKYRQIDDYYGRWIMLVFGHVEKSVLMFNEHGTYEGP